MKKYLFGFIFACAFFTSYSFASSSNNDLTELIEKLDKLIELISSEPSQKNSEVKSEKNSLMNAIPENSPFTRAFDNYKTWPKSGTYDASDPWNLDFMIPPQSSYSGESSEFLDLNGDGLLDYFYHKNDGNIEFQCNC